MTRSLRTLLDSIVDYAGLFPPASLGMTSAVRNYASYLAGPESWMLGRFIVPAGRLGELADARRAHAEADPGSADATWRLSVLTAPAGEPALGDDLARAHAFNEEHAPADALDPDEDHAPTSPAGSGGGGGFVIDTIELRAPSSGAIDSAIERIPEGLNAFFEIPIDRDPRGLIAAMAGEPGVGAKVRCGGVSPEAFPQADDLARFIAACAAAAVPFKATAGLHHPLRAEHRLTYDPDPPRGVMFGFLNVFLAASYASGDRMAPPDIVRLLEERDAASLQFPDMGASWRGRRLDTERIARARESFALSFGSCSFEEPVDDLRSLGLL